MPNWKNFFSMDGQDRRDNSLMSEARRHLLPSHRHELPPSPIPAREVTKIALRLKYQVEQVIPCEVEEFKVTKANSGVITQKVIQAAREAGGEEHKACVVYCLLVCTKWFQRQAKKELWDADLHDVRAVACQVLAKRIIEDEDDTSYLMEHVLLKRYSIIVNGAETSPANVIERSVDLHAVIVIGSSGYQKCVHYLWRGWLVQDDDDASRFVEYEHKANTDYWVHFDPDRMRVPQYQKAVQIGLSFIYLGLYTGAINTINPEVDLDVVEGLLYIFTVGFIFDEFAKFWKVGRYYLSFWNIFNISLYSLLTVSFVTRMIALGKSGAARHDWNTFSYNFLAFTAPMFWIRILLYLDSFQFFGAMLVVLKVMMRESLIFFSLLIVVLIGFFQAFIGLDNADDNKVEATSFIWRSMLNAIMQSPEFDGFDNFGPPFGMILYYLFAFVVMVILLNVLIALYNSAYEDITGNAADEYMALFAQRTMQFVRAPDENVFIAPFNLIEIFLLVLPFEWWLPRPKYERLNDIVMGTIYSPVLLITAYFEAKAAHTIKRNRNRNEEDEDTIEEWEQLMGEVDFEEGGWSKKVEATKPNLETDADILEMRKVRGEVKELKELIESLKKELEEKGKWGDESERTVT